VIESLDFTLKMAEQISMCASAWAFLHLQIFLDKANRTSVQSFRGQTVETGLEILQRVKDEIGAGAHRYSRELPSSLVAPVVDVLQIPAFLCRQPTYSRQQQLQVELSMLVPRPGT